MAVRKPRPADLPPENIRNNAGHITEEAKAWFYKELRRSGRNPYKLGESIGISRASVRNLLRKVEGQWSDGNQLGPAEIAERLYRQSNEEGFEANPDHRIFVEIPPPLMYDDLNENAKQAYNELGYWRTRYLGRRNILWQVEMCLIIMSWFEEAQRQNERVRGVLNTPPGGGKTTTVTHDFPGWMISRDRNIRIGLGSRTTPQATAYSRRLRNTLERNTLLNVDFGRFKPEETEVWRQDEFIVDGVTGSEASIEFRLALAGYDYHDPRTRARLDDPEDPIWEVLRAIESVFVAGEKEPTVKALSQQMGFLGGRFDLNLWDDLVDNKNSGNPDIRNTLAEWWEEYAVSRAEPGGIIALVGTRFGRYDLFRYCRDMTYSTDEDFDSMLMDRVTSTMDEETIAAIKEDLMREIYDNRGDLVEAELVLDPDTGEPTPQPKRMKHKVYRYVKFPAHDEENCENPTSLKSVDHVDCLLDPVRFRWHDLLRAKESNPRKFALTYQQLDESTEDNLIQEVWLTGGTDENNYIFPGCYNYGRRLLEKPDHIDKETDGYLPRVDTYSVCTVDPSAVNFWSIQWWLWQRNEDKDYLMDLLRARLTADSFLSYSLDNGEFHGVADQWQKRSVDMGLPIGIWIIEEAAAQRYLFQHTWVQEWQQMHNVVIKGHETNRKKAEEDFGPQTLRPRYRTGRVDLPFAQEDMRTRAAINEFKQELTEWPDAPTQDMVMGHWFLEHNRYKLPTDLTLSKIVDTTPIKHPFQDQMSPDMQRRSEMDRMGERPQGRLPGHRNARHRRDR